MFGPGTYRSDPTEGITATADLPPPEIVPYSRTHKRQACPRCGYQAYRDKEFHRTLHDLGNLDGWCPRDLVVTYSQHYCTKCRKYFTLIGSRAFVAYGDVDGPSTANNHLWWRTCTARLLRRSDTSSSAHGCAGTRS